MPAYSGSAKLIRGTEVCEEIKERLRKEIMDLDVIPKLAILQVGGREDSNVYIRAKIKFAADVGVKAEHFALPRTSTEKDVSRSSFSSCLLLRY
jgi:methylenetetrahydrofolate dehydrogenase (NADP+)/methenyltetrahydrofolate cyclohydrolase/formyltetrahydrofolate synthetase